MLIAESAFIVNGVFAVLYATLVFIIVVFAKVVHTLVRLMSDKRQVRPNERKLMTVVSRSFGGTVGVNEVTLVAEHGEEYVRLPPGSPETLDVLRTALLEGTVLLIVGAGGPRHVLLPSGTQVFTAAQTIEMLRMGGIHFDKDGPSDTGWTLS